jgi:hypothetical protein
MRVVRVLWRFGVDFVIGDDPKIAVAVVLALAVGALLVTSTAAGLPTVAVVTAATIVAAFTVGLAVDTRGRKR